MYYSGIFSEELRRTTKNHRIAGVLSEIRTEYLPNTSLERYCYPNLSG
jgi:hypothetical protein